MPQETGPAREYSRRERNELLSRIDELKESEELAWRKVSEANGRSANLCFEIKDLETHESMLHAWAERAESGRFSRPDTGWPVWECSRHAFAVAARVIRGKSERVAELELRVAALEDQQRPRQWGEKPKDESKVLVAYHGRPDLWWPMPKSRKEGR